MSATRFHTTSGGALISVEADDCSGNVDMPATLSALSEAGELVPGICPSARRDREHETYEQCCGYEHQASGGTRHSGSCVEIADEEPSGVCNMAEHVHRHRAEPQDEGSFVQSQPSGARTLDRCRDSGEKYRKCQRDDEGTEHPQDQRWGSLANVVGVTPVVVQESIAGRDRLQQDHWNDEHAEEH